MFKFCFHIKSDFTKLFIPFHRVNIHRANINIFYFSAHVQDTHRTVIPQRVQNRENDNKFQKGKLCTQELFRRLINKIPIYNFFVMVLACINEAKKRSKELESFQLIK